MSTTDTTRAVHDVLVAIDPVAARIAAAAAADAKAVRLRTRAREQLETMCEVFGNHKVLGNDDANVIEALTEFDLIRFVLDDESVPPGDGPVWICVERGCDPDHSFGSTAASARVFGALNFMLTSPRRVAVLVYHDIFFNKEYYELFKKKDYDAMHKIWEDPFSNEYEFSEFEDIENRDLTFLGADFFTCDKFAECPSNAAKRMKSSS